MSAKIRGDRIQLLQKVVTKHYTPVSSPEDRTVLEHLLYACCLEDTPFDAADEAFHRLQESFFDWNEVRVTTVSELCETLHNVPEPAAAALRIKKNLQSLFETRYTFDIEDMIKMNQGKAIQELEKLAGMTKFVLAYVTQKALGGHAIAVSKSIMQVLLATEIVSQAEADKGQVPGLERTVPKTKGEAFASCLHQLAIDYATSSDSKQTKSIMKEAGAVDIPKQVEAKGKRSKAATSGKAKGSKPQVAPTPPTKATSGKKSTAKARPSKAANKTTNKKAANSSVPGKSKSAASKKLPAKKAETKKTTKRKPR